MLTKNESSTLASNIVRDYLGSITAIKPNLRIKSFLRMSYDAWGRCQNPTTLSLYAPGRNPRTSLVAASLATSIFRTLIS